MIMSSQTMTWGSEFEARCAAASCRTCGQRGLMPILDLGHMPPSDRLVSEQQLDQEEARFPLELAFCPGCALVQIIETVPPEYLFGEDYLYYSSFSPALLEHARRHAEQAMAQLNLGRRSFVVELASNDGYLLQYFARAGVPVLGIDPAPHQAEAAREKGVPTRCAFFDEALAEQIAAEDGQADLVIASNVLAHVADTNGFVRGIARLLKKEGAAEIEVPYVRHLIDKCEFDTIYHEHLCYFSVTALDRLFRRHGLYLNDVQELAIHGGSLRLTVQHREQVSERVGRLLAEEQRIGLDGIGYYEDFGTRVRALRQTLRETVLELAERWKQIAAYGAAAKGTILLNYTGLDASVIDFVVDRNVHKHGKYMPGVRVPILEVAELERAMPDYTLLLAWNFRDEILAQQQAYRDKGGQFIIPVPEVEIV